MKSLRILSALVLLLATGQSAHAQTAILTGIDDFAQGKLLSITVNRNVAGYVFIYKLHEKDTIQHLRIFDENLQKIGESSVSTGKKSIPRQVIYESGHLLLSLYDQIDSYGFTESLKVLNLDNSVVTKSAPMPSEKPKGMFTPRVYPMGYYTSVPSQGFLGTYDADPYYGGATCVMLDTAGKQLWKKVVREPGKGYSGVSLVGTTRNSILYYITVKDNAAATDGKGYLVGLDPLTGEQRFHQLLRADGEDWQPLFVKPISDDTALICSQLTDEKDNLTHARQTGFNYGKIDLKTGAVTSLKTVHYATDLNGKIEMTNSTKSSEGFMHLQNVLLFPDGSAVVVGEFFRRTVNGAGMALAVLGANAVQGTTGDMFFMRLTPEGRVTEVNRVDMRPERISMPLGTTIAALGRYLDGIGAFNYHHADDWDPEHKTVVIIGKAGEDESGGLSVKVAHITPTNYEVKTLLSSAKLKEEPARLSKAKPGHVMLMKYNLKSKSTSLELMRTD
jgi:hypothetical protein